MWVRQQPMAPERAPPMHTPMEVDVYAWGLMLVARVGEGSNWLGERAGMPMWPARCSHIYAWTAAALARVHTNPAPPQGGAQPAPCPSLLQPHVATHPRRLLPCRGVGPVQGHGAAAAAAAALLPEAPQPATGCGEACGRVLRRPQAVLAPGVRGWEGGQQRACTGR